MGHLLVMSNMQPFRNKHELHKLVEQTVIILLQDSREFI